MTNHTTDHMTNDMTNDMTDHATTRAIEPARRSIGGRMLLVVVAAALVASCAGDDPEDTPTEAATDGDAVIVATTDAPATTPAPTEPPPVDTEAPATSVDDGVTTTSSTSTTAAPTTSTTVPVVGDPVVALVEVARLEQPVDLAVRAGDDAVYVVEQPGRVVRLAGDQQAVVADVTDRTTSNGEQGLLGLAFSPDGDLAYLDYTDAGGTTVVAEYAVAADGTFDIATERIVITVAQPYRNHNAGDLEFGPDGMLYIPLGDGGAGGDPERRASDPTSFLGSMLRIDPRPSGDLPYTVPSDNPFADGEHEGVAGAPEVWSWGLRNPWKIAFDPVTGELWIADVGQNRLEEINLVAPSAEHGAGFAADFGWSAFEGTERYNDDVPDPGDTVMPVLVYPHGDSGCSTSGGVPYRGTAIPELAPAYLYSDYCSGRLWALDLAGGRNLTLLTGLGPVTAVRSGPDREVWVLAHSGEVRRLVAG